MRWSTPRSGTSVPSAKGAGSGRRPSRAAIQPPCFCGEFARLLQAAARRHGEHDFTRHRMDAQRIAPRLPMPAHAHQIDFALESNADRRRLARPAIKQRAQRHRKGPPNRKTSRKYCHIRRRSQRGFARPKMPQRRKGLHCHNWPRSRRRSAVGRSRLGRAGIGAVAASAPAVMRKHEIGDTRRDIGAEARAVEHAVMADPRLQIMRLGVGRNVRAQNVRGLGLADRGNVVVLAFDREQRDALDLRRDRCGGRDASSRPWAARGG